MVHWMKSLDIGLQIHDEFCSLQSYTLHKGFSGSKQESYMCDQLERLEGVMVAF